jgi:hypothetical protein
MENCVIESAASFGPRVLGIDGPPHRVSRSKRSATGRYLVYGSVCRPFGGLWMPTYASKRLTASEAAVLTIIQQGYGSQNTVDEVFFTDADEAAIFVKASIGTSPVMANLTNLAAWRADGTISGDEELKREWLRLE